MRNVTASSERTHGNQTREGQLEVVLPGERSADRELIETAVADLNRLHHETALSLACATGEYLLARFFNGDVRRFRERGQRHVSFRELAAREDLHFSATSLWTAIAVVEQMRQLPGRIGHRLPLSHHRLLLPVKDPRTKEELASRALDEGLSKRQLAEAVRHQRQPSRPGSRRGRPPIPITVKRLHQLRRSASEVLEMKASALDIGDYSPRAARELLSELVGELQEVSQVVDRLHGALDRAQVRGSMRT